MFALLLRRASPLSPASRAYCEAASLQAAPAAHQKAMSYATRGEYGPALWGFRRAVELDLRNAVHWNDLGVTLLRLQRFAHAEAAFLASLSRDGGNRDARNNLAETRGYLERAGAGVAIDAAGGGSALVAAGGGGGGGDALALALTEEEATARGGADCSQLAAALAGAPAVRLAPPLDDASYAAFIRATGIRHAVRRLPRVHARDLGARENRAYRTGAAAYILVGSAAPSSRRAFLRAGNATLLQRGRFANDTADFYPQSMVQSTVHPTLAPFHEAVEELLRPSPAYPLNDAPRGGRYLHFNMGWDQWRAYLAMLKWAPPPPLGSSDAWLAGAYDTPDARSDFLIGNHWRMVLIGSEGAGMFSHQDILKTGSYQLQIAGVKTWHVCAPTESHKLSVDMDMFAPDYARWPAALGASCWLDALAPGEVLYYPADYWHQTLNTPAAKGELSVAITDTVVDCHNQRLVQGGLLDKCKAPAMFNRGGMTADACTKLPALFEWWDREIGVACEAPEEEEEEEAADAAWP